ncbi:MAG: formylglycine-generating enzyme family protein [Anaerolineae bacterium]|nr:formylglycine-generating enzyme family protein [Anaerolineae bacterium]
MIPHNPQPKDISTLMPPPWNWAAIPGGTVTLDHTGGYLMQAVTVEVGAFQMARYPITRAQFQVFVDAPGGYGEARWWDYSAAARLWRLEHDEPAVDYGPEDAPRTHVNWYEAVAFCQWMSAQAGHTIRLPTEAEWQHAAQGEDGRPYPWGQEWDDQRCKNGVTAKHIGPGSVREFEGPGDSPFGVVGMAGNVWEWCLTSWKTGANDLRDPHVRVLRGGSWFDDVVSFFRTTTRQSWNPDLTSDLRGFRVIRTD